MASSSPTKEEPKPSSPSPPAAAAISPPPPSAATGRRLPPPCWTHEETLALIESYRDKWFALRRGNLRAADWEEVAVAVAARCSALPAASPKTPVQCRHKVEKLRKRFRAERLRSSSRSSSSSWPYFPLLASMDLAGPNPSPNPNPSPSPSLARRPPSPPSSSSSDEEVSPRRRSSLHRLMSNGGGISGGGINSLRFTIPKASRSKIAAAPRRDPNPSFFKKGMEMRREEEKDGGSIGEMAAALRRLGDGFLRMEQMKMEMAREMEKVRMDMELKRTEMILDSQQRIVDAFVEGFYRKKRAKVTRED
ncbi:uncharacterized protein [Typha angustifolia]|uniref:uncharacterized protein n=1 Tax=Typha angustifolia TaxID=59011 RepID=UPI003C2ABC7B